MCWFVNRVPITILIFAFSLTLKLAILVSIHRPRNIPPDISRIRVGLGIVSFVARTEEQDITLHIIVLLCFLVGNNTVQNETNQHKYTNVSLVRIQYKVASITYKVPQSEQPSYLHKLRNVQSYRRTRSSDVTTLHRPSVRSRLKVTDRSFIHHAPVLWNSLPKQLRQPAAPPSHGTATDSAPILALSSLQFHSKLKTFIFEQSFPS